MDEDLNENETLNEDGYTAFPAAKSPSTGAFGRFGTFFAKAFRKQKKKGRPFTKPPLEGDAQDPKSGDTFEDYTTGIGVNRSGMPKMPKVEVSRKRKYQDFESMDEYPEIGAALDIYADDATLVDDNTDFLKIQTEDRIVKEEIERFFDTIEMKRFLWDIARNVAKYGDCFCENIIDLNNTEAGIQRLKILNPNFVYRKEDQYGYLKGFMQEIPKKGYGDANALGGGGNSPFTGGGTLLNLDKNQIIHFRKRTSDQNFYPYGKSILAAGVRAWKSLKMMEDAMLIYRLQRAPERRAFYIETGNLPQTKVENFMERIKQKFKKEKFWNAQSGTIDERYNPLSADEDFFIPVRNGQGAKVEVLPGAQNLGDIDDVKYFRDKLLSALKIPKDYIVEQDSSPERKANLSQLDVKFAKSVMRLQRDIEIGIETLIRRHLKLREFPLSMMKNFKIQMIVPSDLFEKKRLEADEQKLRIVQAVKGLQLFPDNFIYKRYFDMTEYDIVELKEELKKASEEEQQAQQQMGGGMPGAPGAPGMPPGPGGMPPGGAPPEGPAQGGGPGGLGGAPPAA